MRIVKLSQLGIDFFCEALKYSEASCTVLIVSIV